VHDPPKKRADEDRVASGPGSSTTGIHRPGEIRGAKPPPASHGNRWASSWFGYRPELVPGIAAIGVFAYWSLSDGGVIATYSYPGGIALLGLLAATLYGYRQRLLLPRVVLLAIALLAAFVVWNFLSITWAGDQGSAWDGANRCLMYLVTFTIFAIPRWRSGSALIVLGLYAGIEAAIGAGSLIAAAGDANPFASLVAGRFSAPTTYHNATAALFTGAMFPAIFLASRRETPWAARGAMLAAAGILFQISLLPQSRGWLLALPLAGIAYCVLVPGRVRSLIAVLPLAVVGALTAGPMLDVWDRVTTPGALGPALDHARNVMLVSAAALFVAGAMLGLADRRIALPESWTKIASRAVAVGAAVAVVAGATLAIGAVGNPATWVSDQWGQFKSGQAEQSADSSRLTQGLGSNRYDFWRVAANEFAAHPLNGVGTENFAVDYVRERHTIEEPLHPHSLPLQILAQTGLVGAVLFLGFLTTALITIGRIRIGFPSALTRGATGVIAVFFVYWLLHSSGDWFWAFPAISAPVFGFLGMGMRIDAAESPTGERRAGRRLAFAGAPVLALAAASMLLPWMAALYVKDASANWPANPQKAFQLLDRARQLDFLSAQPDLVAGTIAVRLRDEARARSAFDDALTRFPSSWYPRLELAALDALQGRPALALEGLRRVEELNPREPLTAEVRAGIERGQPVTLNKIDSELRYRVCQRIGQVPSSQGCAAK
jgi:hypothetical protein